MEIERTTNGIRAVVTFAQAMAYVREGVASHMGENPADYIATDFALRPDVPGLDAGADPFFTIEITLAANPAAAGTDL